MDLTEQTISLIVEQVLKEMALAHNECYSLKTNVSQVDSEEELCDLAAIDLQRQLLVPDPINRCLYEDMKLATPARIGVWRTGSRPLTQTLLRFRSDHAAAQDSVLGEVAAGFPEQYKMVVTHSLCSNEKDEYLTRPDLGRKLDQESIKLIRRECIKGAQIQIIVSDGLSSNAVEANIPDLLPALLQGLEGLGLKVGTPIFVQHGRVTIMDVISEELKPEVAIILIGERPGLGTAESMSAYIGYNPRIGMVESERTVISNIHKGGTPAAEAGAHLATLLKRILDAKASGVNLDQEGCS